MGQAIALPTDASAMAGAAATIAEPNQPHYETLPDSCGEPLGMIVFSDRRSG